MSDNTYTNIIPEGEQQFMDILEKQQEEQLLDAAKFCNEKMAEYTDNWIFELANALGWREE